MALDEGRARETEVGPQLASVFEPHRTRWFRAAVVIAAALLLALTWYAEIASTRAHSIEARARVEAEVSNEALALEEQLNRQLLTIDQTLRIVELEWERDPAAFDLDVWARQTVALIDVSLQLFVADERGTVRASSRPEIIGNDVSGRDYFRHAAALPADDEKMFVGSLIRGQTTQHWQLNLVHRLDRGTGVFAGVVSASYDMSALANFYRKIDLGPRGLVAVVDATNANLNISVVANTVEPDPTIAGSPIFRAMIAAPSGRWTGPSSGDGVDRIHAFRRIPGRSLIVLVGVDRAAAMQPTDTWEQGSALFAAGISVLLLAMAGLLLRNERQAREYGLALNRDRAALASANAQTRAKAAQLQATIVGMSDGVMMVDAELNLLEWNEHFPAFTGVPAEILRVGLPMAEIVRAQAIAGEFGEVDTEAEVDRRIGLLRAGDTTGTVERARPTGDTVELRRNALPGGGFVTLYTDVTARRLSEDRLHQAQTMASIGRLTAGVAHDFNNLLASIIGNAQMLERELRDDPRQARRVSIILRASDRGAALVRQLLAFARRQTLAPARLDVNTIVREMRELLEATLGGTIALEFDFDANLWPAVADPVQLEHVILNLVINARDAMPDGGKLSINTAHLCQSDAEGVQDLPAGDYVAISVSDSGTGMSEEVRRGAFEPFFTTKEPGKGSGLGLSQVYGFARQSGGAVEIESELGYGTTVRVYLPRAPAATELGAATTATDPQAAP